MFFVKLFAIFTAIQGLNCIFWDKLTIQKDPRIMFRESLERRRVYQNCCCLHFCFLRTWSWKAPGKAYEAGKRCPLWCEGKCQSGSSTVARLWSWWIPCQPPESSLAPGMMIAQRMVGWQRVSRCFKRNIMTLIMQFNLQEKETCI